MTADLLFEIGVEEIPATAVLPALEQLRQLVEAALERLRLEHGAVQVWGTPRRLTALAQAVATRQADAITEHKGPPAQQAFDDEGKPTKAALGFARARGVAVEDLQVRETDKGTFVFAEVREPGKDAVEVLPEALAQVVSSLTFPKTMRWGEGDFRFCRPLRWLVAMLGEQVVPVEVAGVTAGKVTRGHRVFGAAEVPLESPADYLPRLRENYVIADHAERRETIVQALQAAAAEVGGRPRLHDDLLDEVTFLVEYPTAVLGAFDQRFLELPEPVAVKVMEGHQRFFVVEDEKGRLMPYFLGVRDGTDEGLDQVRRGYEWVVEPRLEDAEFYLQEDLKTPFAERVELLKRVTFIAGAGTLYDKTRRLERVVGWLGAQVGADADALAAAERAAELSKCDLTTMMIGDTKLGELQGVIGGEYARRSGEPEAVAVAIAEHYRPRGAGDQPPATLPGQLLASADRLDSLATCYALGLRPSGSQDPYALRRAMQGLIAIAVAGGLRYALSEALAEAYAALQASEPEAELEPAEDVVAALRELAAQRLAAALEEAGVRYDLARAVNAAGWRDFVEAWQRAHLLAAHADDEDWEQVVLAGQRISNIYRPAAEQAAEAVDEALLEDEAERELLVAARAADEAMARASELGQWDELWRAVLDLTPVVHRFFDEVLVMAEDEAVRANRLALLGMVQSVLFRLADFREVVLA